MACAGRSPSCESAGPLLTQAFAWCNDPPVGRRFIPGFGCKRPPRAGNCYAPAPGWEFVDEPAKTARLVAALTAAPYPCKPPWSCPKLTGTGPRDQPKRQPAVITVNPRRKHCAHPTTPVRSDMTSANAGPRSQPISGVLSSQVRVTRLRRSPGAGRPVDLLSPVRRL